MSDKKKQQNDSNPLLEECQKEKEEFLNNWKRERADFENYKKEESRRVEDFLKFANEGLLLEAIDVIDDLETADKNLPDIDSIKEWRTGFESLIEKFNNFLKKHGVERILVKNQKFDPLVHEAVEIRDSDGQDIDEVRPGYTMHGKVIRPARVRIVKN